MTRSFTLTRSDFSALQKAAVAQLRGIPGLKTSLLYLRVFCWIFVGLAGFAYAGLYERHPDLGVELGFVGALLVLAFLALPVEAAVTQRLVQKHLVSEHGTFLSPQTVTIDEEGITLRTRGADATYSWSAFLAYSEDSNNYYLFVEPAQAVVLPKAALAGDEGLAHRLHRFSPKRPTGFPVHKRPWNRP